jgi:hypothetical protein
MPHRLRLVVVAVALSLGLGGASAAHAAGVRPAVLSQCFFGWDPWTVWSRCTVGTGQQHVQATIINQTTHASKVISGPCVGRGSTSLAAIPTGWAMRTVGPRQC